VHTRHPADTTAYKSLLQKDIHLIISLHNNIYIHIYIYSDSMRSARNAEMEALRGQKTVF